MHDDYEDDYEEPFISQHDREIIALRKENFGLRQERNELSVKLSKTLYDLMVALDTAAYRQMLLACRGILVPAPVNTGTPAASKDS